MRWQALSGGKFRRNPNSRSTRSTRIACLVFIAVTALRLQADVQLLSLTNAWRYQQTTNLDGVNWQSPAYDDSLWPAGNALLYVESNFLVSPRNTLLTLGRTTYYFRTRFNVPFELTNAVVTFSSRIDDGAVLYLNGRELQRVRMPAGPAPVNYDTLASSTPPGGDATSPDAFTLSGTGLTNLVSGDNVLAVEVHQNITNSNDIVFGSAVTWRFTNAPPIFVAQPASVTVMDGRPATLAATVEGNPTPSLQWFKESQAITSTTNASLHFAGAYPTNAGTYRLTATNTFGGLTSSNAVLTVLEDTNPPVIVSAVAQKNLTNIVISFSEPILSSTATVTNNYEVFQTSLPSNRLDVANVSLSGNSGIVLRTTTRIPGLNYSLRVNGIRDVSSVSNQIAPNSEVALSYQVDLIAVAALTTWKYFQAGVQPATNWASLGYDDSAWPSGAALFHAGTPLPGAADPVRTTLSLSNGGNAVQTFYFRTVFDLPGPVDANSLRLHDIADDGAVFYLNGSEAFSIGMPTNRPVPYATPASRSVGTANYEPSLAAPGWVIPGTNIVTLRNSFAAEVHQNSSGLSDVAFGAILDAVITHYNLHPRLSIPALTQEGAGTISNQAQVSILEAQETNLVLQLTSSRPADITVPAEVTIPAGATNALFNLVVGDDTLLNGPRLVILSAESAGLSAAIASLQMLDNETNTIGLVLAPVTSETNVTLSGEVRFSQPADEAIRVSLASSDVTELVVPATVTIPAGTTSVVFQVTIVDDTFLDGPQSVTLSASVGGWPTGSANVTVDDNEPRTITVILPVNVVEGVGTLVGTGKVQLAGIAVSNLTVELSSSLPTLVSVMSNITVIAGQSNAVFDLTVADTAFYEGARTVVINAAIPGFTTESNSTTVLDNDAHHFAFDRIHSPQYTNQLFTITVTALTLEGERQTNFNGFCGLAANGQSGTVFLQPTSIGSFVSGAWTGLVQILTSERFVRLQTLTAPGLSEPFHVEPTPYRVVNLQAEDLIYDPVRQRIYASVPSLGGIHSNSVAAIDPVAGTIVWSLPVGEIVRPMTSGKYRSGKLARSDDGQFLYVTVSNALAVQRVNLASQTRGPVFSIGPGGTGTALSAADLVVLSGTPTSVAVARADGFNAHGVAIYDNGVRRPNTTPEFTVSDINVIEPSANSSILLGYNNQNTGFGFSRIAVNSSGASVLDETSGLLTGFDADIVYNGAFVFGSFGAVVNPLSPSLVGQFNVESSFVCCKYVAPDTAMGRAFFLSQVGSNQHLQGHDLGTFLALKALDIPPDGGGGRALVRWGTNGLAFATSGGNIYLVQSSLLMPNGSPADLVVAQVLAAAPVAGSNFTINITVSNQGPDFASEVVLAETLLTNNALVSVFLSQGIWSLNASALKCSFGMIAPGSNATASVTLRSPVGGWQTNRVTVVANELDPNLSNNISAQEYFVQIDARPNSVSQIALPVNDLVFDPNSQKLYTSIPSRAGAHGNVLLMIEPTSGVPASSMFVGDEPGRFAMSENDQYLYVAINTNQSVRRIDLPSQTAGLEVVLGTSLYVEDMAVLPGQPESIAVSRQTPAGTSSGFTHDAIAVYDNGIPRPNTGKAPSHFSRDVVEFGADASMIFAHNSGAVGFNRLALDSQGVTFLDSDAALLGNFAPLELEFAEGLLYFSSGLVIDPLSRTVVGRTAGVTNGAAVLFDPPTRRVFYLQPSGANCQLLVFEPGSLISLGSLNVTGISGSPSGLTRWGPDGFAFRTTGDQLFILRTALVPTNPPADLVLSLASTSATVYVGSNYTFNLLVHNQGPSVASSVTLTNELPPCSTVVSVSSSQGSCSNLSGRVICDLGQLADGATATVAVTIQPCTNGLLSFSAIAAADTLDRTNSNNRVNWLAWSTAANSVTHTIASFGFNDIAADPMTGRLYASLSSTGAPFANALMWIDPNSGQIGQPVAIGPNPNRLAVSSDGHYLYVGLDDANAVRQFDLLNQTPGPQFTFGSGQKAVDLAVSPTNALQVVVYRTYDGKIARYDNGVKAANELSGMTVFAFSDVTGELYSCDGAHSGVPLYRVNSIASGLSLADSQPGHQSSTAELKSDGGLLFYNRGMVVDPVARRVKAVMPVLFNSLVEPDVNMGRVFYLTPAGTSWTLRAFDLKQAVEIGAMALTGISGTPKRLVRWGSDGLAVCTSVGQLVILQGMLVPGALATDLALRQTASASSITTNDIVTFTLSLTNNGPALAQNIVVTQAFSLSVTGVTATPSDGTASWSNNLVSWRPGSLATSTVASLTVSVRPTQNGTLTALAAARHIANDPSWANNAALTVVNAQPAATLNILQIRLPTRELVYDAQRDVLYASLPASNQFLGNIIGIISPVTGNVLGGIFAGSDPNQLALSDDTNSLYVSLDGTTGAKRFNLQTAMADLDFQFGTNDIYYAQDLEVQPGHPQTVAASLGSFNLADGYPSTVAVYDSGTELPMKGGPSRGLAFSADGSYLFGRVSPGTSYGFIRMWLGPDGILITESLPGFSAIPSELKFSNGRLYGYPGQVIEPFVPVFIGSVPASGPLAVDGAGGRVFYLTQAGANWELRAFDIGTLQAIGTQVVANVQGVPGNLIRCGADRLAFRTSSDQLFIVRSSLVPTNQLIAANLGVSQQAAQDFAAPTETLRFVITVTNRGPAAASNVLLAIKPPSPVASVALQLPQGTSTNANGNYLCNLGAMAANQHLQVVLSAVITNTLNYSNFVSVSAAAPDPDFSDNTSLIDLKGVYFQRPDTVRSYPAGVRDLAYDSNSRRLFASLSASNTNGMIAWFNPETADLEGSLQVHASPDHLAISDNGEFLYISFVNTGLVQRVHVPSRAVDYSFNLPANYPVQAMSVLPGQPHSLVVAGSTFGGAFVAVFDDGVPRTNQPGNPFKLLAVSSDGGTVYGYDNSSTGGASPDVFRMTVDNSGLNLSGTGPSDTPWGNLDMDYSGGRLYFGNGEVMNPSTWTLELPFPKLNAYQFVEINETPNLAAFLAAPYETYNPAQFAVYDLSTRQQLQLVSIPGVNQASGVGSLTRCGADRLAFRAGGSVVFIRSSAIPTADLMLQVSLSTNQVRVGDTVTLQLVVFNAGPYAVSGVSLTNMLPPGVNLVSFTSSQGTVSTNGQNVVAALGSLAANAMAMLNLTVSPGVQALGFVTNSAEVFGSSIPDAILFNNRAGLSIMVLPKDTDHDGLPDDWELAHGLNPTNSIDAVLDSDCDGQSNLQEYQTGSDPLRFNNIRLLSPRIEAEGRLDMTVQAAMGKTYLLEISTNLIHWSPHTTFVCRDLDHKIKLAPLPALPQAFFRLRTDTNAALPLLDLIKSSALATNPPLLQITAPPGRRYLLQASTNLVHWTDITNYYGLSCTTVIADPTSPVLSIRFYRVLAP